MIDLLKKYLISEILILKINDIKISLNVVKRKFYMYSYCEIDFEIKKLKSHVGYNIYAALQTKLIRLLSK